MFDALGIFAFIRTHVEHRFNPGGNGSQKAPFTAEPLIFIIQNADSSQSQFEESYMEPDEQFAMESGSIDIVD
jgi:hypothetical protein